MLQQERTRKALHQEGVAAMPPHGSPPAPVVVAVDGGWAGRRAVGQAGLEAERRGAGVVVVTVISTPWSGHDGVGDWRDADHDAVETAHAVNASALRELRLTRPQLPVESIVAGTVGELAPLRAGLLVLGRAGAGGRGVFRMGTTSGELMAALRCPVLVCRDERMGESRSAGPALRRPEVVAAVHSDTEIPTLLRRAVDEATLRGLPLCVFTLGGDPSIDVRSALATQATSLPWRIVQTSGPDTAEAIRQYADPDDLLVLGNRGGGRLAGHVRGSVTRAVLDDMPCDVLLVPVPDEHARGSIGDER